MPIKDGVMTIAPEDIALKGRWHGHLWDAFGNHETEVSASWLVSFAQTRGKGWEPFALAEIEAFYNERGFRNFSFNRLLDTWIVRSRDSKVYSFTEDFITRCYVSVQSTIPRTTKG